MPSAANGWRGSSKTKRYASDLLLPEALFRPAATAYTSMDFDTVRELATIFDTSRPATAIGLAEKGPLPTNVSRVQRGRT